MNATPKIGINRITKKLAPLFLRSPTLALLGMNLLSQDLWEKGGERMALSSFHEAAEEVPAYRDFLLKHGLEEHKQVKTIEDFKEMVPIMDKENYVKRYPLGQRSIEEIHNTVMFSTSGGTTAEPILVNHTKDEFNGLKIWLYYVLGDLSRRILYINAFAQGTWAGGLITNKMFERMAEDPKMNLSVVTPGLNAELVISLIDTIGKSYDVVILAGYPAFLRFLYYEGVKRGFNWNAHKLILMCAGESVGDLKRFFVDNYKINPFFELLNEYGASEIGGIGLSTPLSCFIEGLYEQNPTYFSIAGPASFFQYCPMHVYLEELEGELLVTRNTGLHIIMPLIRYKLSDAVKLYKYAEMRDIWQNHFNADPIATIKNVGFSKRMLKWPFCVFRGRSDQSVVLAGVNIYPDEVAYALNLDQDHLINSFSFAVEEDVERRFLIYLELFPGTSIPASELPDVTKRYHDLVVENLLKINMSFQYRYKAIPTMHDPVIKICSYGEGPFKDDHKRVKPKHLLDDKKSNRD